ncbi:MAG: MerR family transcriptional regulator [Candidatus Omnitrophica bacterium]|nr:MerR family transcriptional regulator [Candidatus Omnitrophota bacterium]
MDDNGKRLTITEVADRVGVTVKTIIRWEKAGRIKKAKRDWKGWRSYTEAEISDIEKITTAVYEV